MAASVALVLGEIDPDAAACHRHEPGETRFELVLPFLLEAEARVPRNSTNGVLDVEDGHDLFHHVEASRSSRRALLTSRRRWASSSRSREPLETFD